MTKQYVVHASGKRSKPATKERIREMYDAGKIPDEAMVHSVDSGKSIPIVEFLDRSRIRREPASSVVVRDGGTQTEPPVQTQDVVSLWQPAEADEVPPVAPQLHSQSAPMGGSRAVRTFFLFRGFNIPKTGVVETRDYLQRTVGWLELWLKWVHFTCVVDLVVWILWGIHVIMRLFEERQINPAATWQDIAVSIAVPLIVFLVLALVFISLRISEAFLRIVPACIRYWIETTEERRLAKA